MHNPGGLLNIPSRPAPLPHMVLLPYAGPVRLPPASDFIPINGALPAGPPPGPMHYPAQRGGHQRFRTHQGFTNNQFYNRTKRKRDSSNGSRNATGNGMMPSHSSGASGLPVAASNGGNLVANGHNSLDTEANGDIPNIPTPWNPRGLSYSDGVIGLHEEIEDFVQWMVPTRAEHWLRRSVINRLRASIKEIYPSAVIQIFGSFKTGLYLPTSDIDLVLVGHWAQLPFDVVRNAIESNNVARPGSLQVLEHATVPIIKLVDRMTGIRVDISFNMTNGLRSVELIKHYKKKYPALAKLIYVLKQFLLQRDLNEVYTGGLSSYALILMVVSFLQLHPRGEQAGSENANLGVLLIEFFELYGRHFNYSTTAIKINDDGAYVSKEEMRSVLSMGTGLGSLCIQDPCLPGNDVGKSSYGIPVVKLAFEKAYTTLTNLLTSKTRPSNGYSLLSHIVHVSDDVIAFRNWVTSDTTKPFSVDGSQLQDDDDDVLKVQTSLTERNDAYYLNERMTLSDDPVKPSPVAQTPSRGVTPRDLPKETYAGANQPTPRVSKSKASATVTSEAAEEEEAGKEVVAVDSGSVKDVDNMSGVSTTTASTSSSALSRTTDTESDELVGPAEDDSPSGSPSSVMSISPASSEVGSVRNDRVHRNSNTGGNSHHNNSTNFRRGDKDNKQLNRNVGGGRYWNSSSTGHRKLSGSGSSSGKERSDMVLNWRQEGPDKNTDWRNHGTATKRSETAANGNSSNMNENIDRINLTSSDEEKKSLSSKNSTTTAASKPQATLADVANGNAVNSPAQVSEQKSTAAEQDDTGFIKSRTFRKQQRKKQQKRNKSFQNSSTTTATAATVVSTSTICLKSAPAENDKKSLPQNRFSSKAGQSKPNR